MKSSAMNIVQNFLEAHNIQNDTALDEDLCDYILEACAGDMLSVDDKHYLVEDMITGVCSDGDGRAALTEEFLDIAFQYTNGSIEGYTQPPEIKQGEILASSDLKSGREGGSHSKKKSKSKQTTRTKERDSNPSSSRVESSVEHHRLPHILPFASVLKWYGVNMSNTDNDILEYILGVCLDDAADSADLADVVASYFPELNSHIDSDDDDDSMKEIVGQSLRQAAKESAELRDAPENTENVSSAVEKIQSESEPFSNTVDDENTQDSQPEDIVEPDVQELLLIFPHIPIDVVQFIFRVKFAGVKSDAAQYLLENAEEEQIAVLRENMAQFEAKKLKEAEEKRQREKSMKSTIFNRYGETALPPQNSDKKAPKATSGSGKKPPVSVLGNAVLGNTASSRIRYREGKVVTTKGEKVIIEKNPKDDYDGGSRGRIKTKGKRGPGFIIG